MSRAELQTRVAELLSHMGCAEVAQLKRYLPPGVAGAAIRSALKALGAQPRTFGDWPKYDNRGNRWRKYGGDPLSPNTPNYPDRFEAWSLKPWKQAHS